MEKQNSLLEEVSRKVENRIKSSRKCFLKLGLSAIHDKLGTLSAVARIQRFVTSFPLRSTQISANSVIPFSTISHLRPCLAVNEFKRNNGWLF